MNEGNENYFTVKEHRICAYTYENGDYCGLAWEHEGPCWEPYNPERDIELLMKQVQRLATDVPFAAGSELAAYWGNFLGSTYHALGTLHLILALEPKDRWEIHA